jgi:hypothetical protein
VLSKLQRTVRKGKISSWDLRLSLLSGAFLCPDFFFPRGVKYDRFQRFFIHRFVEKNLVFSVKI